MFTSANSVRYARNARTPRKRAFNQVGRKGTEKQIRNTKGFLPLDVSWMLSCYFFNRQATEGCSKDGSVVLWLSQELCAPLLRKISFQDHKTDRQTIFTFCRIL
jgi:hypothetical protein